MTTHFQFNAADDPTAVAAMEAVCEQDYATLKAIYGLGDPPNLPFVVHVDPTVGGAYHLSCEGTEIWTQPTDAPTLLVAEVDEVFQAMTGTWNCGLTNGEAHSRVMAEVVRPTDTPAILDGDIVGWWNNGTPVDYVNDNSQDDQNQQANACGSVFMYYLQSLGFSWNQITAAGASSLGATYTKLTGKSGAQGFSDFVAALLKLNLPADQWSDDPFSGQPIPPPPTPQPGGCNPFGFFFGLFMR